MVGDFSGGLDQLLTSDDEYVYITPGLESDVAVRRVSLTFKATAPGNDFQSITFCLESSTSCASPGADPLVHRQVEFYNFYLNRWDIVHNCSVVPNGIDTFDRITKAPTMYIHPLVHTVMSRVSWDDNGYEMDYARIDKACWTFVIS